MKKRERENYSPISLMNKLRCKNFQYSICKPTDRQWRILVRMCIKWKGQKWECWGWEELDKPLIQALPSNHSVHFTNTLLKSQWKLHRFSATISTLGQILISAIWWGTQTFRDRSGWYSYSISIAQDISSSWYAEFTFSSIIPFEHEPQIGQVLANAN